MVQQLEHRVEPAKHIKVIWSYPPSVWYNGNTDGASRGNLGMSTLAFCIRDSTGDLIVAKAWSIGEGTSVEAEAMAILELIKYSHAHAYFPLMIETDSMLLRNVLEGLWMTPWKISQLVEEIKQHFHGMEYTIHHFYREGNQLADYFTNLAFDEEQVVTSIQQLNPEAKRILILDKFQCPSIRSRPATH